MLCYAKSLQSCPTLCNPIDGSPPGFPIPGILQARTLEWVAISFSNAWKWKVKVKSLSRVQPSATPWTAAFQASPSIHEIFQARVLEWGAIAFSHIYAQACLNRLLASFGMPMTIHPYKATEKRKTLTTGGSDKEQGTKGHKELDMTEWLNTHQLYF